VHVVDMRLEHERSRDLPLFSRLLRSYLAETLDAHEQAILFLNRRGFVPVLWCAGCKLTVRCDQCDMSLTFHRRIRRLVCHGCCEERLPPAACPTCSRPGLSPLGVGSERVESELRTSFPRMRVQRMDSDTMRRREDYEDALERFGGHEIDVLVGTQMIAKGLDFPRVTLVGIISADQALHLPDFRAAERTFQLIAQVAGRAGRADLAGRIVVQSVAPEHPAVRLGARSRYAEFVAQEALWRAEAGYPPHGRLLRVLYEDTDEPRLDARVQQDAERLRACLEGSDTVVLGPAAAPIGLLRGRFRKHMLLKGPEEDSFESVRDVLVDFAQSSAPKVTLDVDPMGML
jgi:primosomal protein N' (replication factor Y)